ncbi:hypothetical protein BDV96DRAFT_661332 [Lophiotrema nucula]|uniref:Uncharacterized protein n=1 Tax=Lophiotrema nucula TaxID=690887 RepID=A0A6A5Z3U0_9PLEO|nr:hypothetical protein BDV96DRAFT_661332 [Lophiotrema nucula]
MCVQRVLYCHDFSEELDTICFIPNNTHIPPIANHCLKTCIKDATYLTYICDDVPAEIGACTNEECKDLEPDRTEGWAYYSKLYGHYPTPVSTIPISTTIPISSTTITIPTTTPPYPTACNSTLCTTTYRPTEITVTTTKIDTLTICPTSQTCTGQTTTWTGTQGPTSCAPTVTCTCVLPGYPTLTSCPRSVTCTGQTTAITGGQTVVFPSETFNPSVEPTTSSQPASPGAAATGGVGLLAALLGVVVALEVGRRCMKE